MSIKMTTRLLAQICETEHKELLKRMRKAIERGAKEEWFEETFYTTNNNRRCPEYLLTYDGVVAILECMNKGLRDNVMYLIKEHFGIEEYNPSTGAGQFKVPTVVKEGIKKLRKKIENKEEILEQHEQNAIVDNATVYNSPEFGQVRVVIRDNEPWFVAADVAKILGYTSVYSMCRRLNEDEKITITSSVNQTDDVSSLDYLSYNNRYTLISESGLCNAVFGSEKPEAKKFKKWVAEETLIITSKAKENKIEDKQEKSIVIADATIFNSPDFGQVRVIIKDNEPWFIAMDIAKILNYSDAEAMCRRLDDDEYRVITPSDLQNVGQNNKINPVFRYLAINESGLYNAIFGSTKQEAKKFRKWVTEDVLPTIRKTGGYVANEDLFIDTYLKHADETTKLMFKGVLETVRKQNEQIERQRKELEHKEDVIIGLIDQISLAEKRQILNRVVRKGGANYSDRWNELYRQFEMKYHIDLVRRIKGYNAHNTEKIKSKLDYIDKVMGKLPELYEIACKLYESDVKELVKELYDISNNS